MLCEIGHRNSEWSESRWLSFILFGPLKWLSKTKGPDAAIDYHENIAGVTITTLFLKYHVIQISITLQLKPFKSKICKSLIMVNYLVTQTEVDSITRCELIVEGWHCWASSWKSIFCVNNCETPAATRWNPKTCMCTLKRICIDNIALLRAAWKEIHVHRTKLRKTRLGHERYIVRVQQTGILTGLANSLRSSL